jgi:hypothetical protein
MPRAQMAYDFDELKRFAESCERAGIKTMDGTPLFESMLEFFRPGLSELDKLIDARKRDRRR